MPALSAAARAGDRAGAEAFFRYFIDVYNYSYASLETGPLRSISAPTCTFCTQAADGIDQHARGGGTFQGGTVSVSTLVVGPGDPSVGLVANAVIEQEASRVLDRSGSTLRTVPADSGVRLDAALAWNGVAWTVLGVDSGRRG